jgi:hypothetical protein
MSLPNSSTLHATHSHQGSHGGRHGGGLGSSVGAHHPPHLGQRSAGIPHIALGATTQQGSGGGAVSPMAYSTPAHSLTFSHFVATSKGHSVSSLSQSQSMLAAKRKGDSHPQKSNAAKRRRGKLDTNNGAKYNAAEKRSGKIDTKDEAEYDDKKDVLPVTDAPFGVKQREERCLAEFNMATVLAAHPLEFMQRAFPPQPANVGKKKTQGTAAASIKACRPQSEVDYIMYILMHWQVSVRLTDVNPGTERDRLQKF